MTLRDRCRAILGQIHKDQMLRQGNPVDTLVEFVAAEIGRSADEGLEKTLPLVLYFGSDADREEFIAIVHELKPGMRAKKVGS